MNRSDWNLANWQGYLAQSTTREERDKRLEAVPKEYLNQVRSHLRTLFKIKEGKKL